MRTSRRARSRKDDGAVLVLTALCMIALLFIVAIVIDLGFTRSDRRGGQSAADSAVLSAAQTYVGSDVEAACETAFAYLALSLDSEQFAGEACSGLPASCVDASDAPTLPATWTARDSVTRATSDGTFEASVIYPVTSGSPELERVSAIGSRSAVETAADGTACQRLGIRLITTQEPLFGTIAGSTERRSSVHAVAAIDEGPPNERLIPAFLMLDRSACQAIFVNTGAGSGSDTLPDGSPRPEGILVQANNTVTPPQPGFVHSDSDASQCGNATGDYAIFAANPSGRKTLFVESASDGSLGRIEAVSTTRPGTGGTNVPVDGGAPVASRQPVDDIYQAAIETLHPQAHDAITTTATPPAGAVQFSGCSTVPSSPPPLVGDWTAYISCPNFNESLALTATSVIFQGDVSLGSARRVLLPNARSIVVRGSLSLSGGGGSNQSAFQAPVVRSFVVGNGLAVGSNAAFSTNVPLASTSPPTANFTPTCSHLGQLNPPTSNHTRMAIFSGSASTGPALTVSSRAAFCRTSVYLAGPHTPARRLYDEQSDETSAGCDDDFPCPSVSANTMPGARFDLAGGTVEWSAPNRTESPSADDLPLPDVAAGGGGLEDLALWAEGGSGTNSLEASNIGNNVTFRTSGIFFAPNSVVEFRSGGAGTDPVDAQFVSRIVRMYAGRFTMKPAPGNAVDIPAAPTLSLIR